MGKGQSKAASLECFTQWTRQKADDLIARYLAEDMTFGLDLDKVSTLLGDSSLAATIFPFFAGEEKTLSAMDL